MKGEMRITSLFVVLKKLSWGEIGDSQKESQKSLKISR